MLKPIIQFIKDKIIKSSTSSDDLEALFNNMNEGFAHHEIILNDEGQPIDYRFLRINKAFERLTGLKHENVIGNSVMTLMPETEKYWVDLYGDVSLNNTSKTFTNYSQALGKYFNVSVYSPKLYQFVTVITDITDTMTLQKEIEMDRALLKTTLMSIGDGVISTDDQGNVQMMNQMAETLTGYNFEGAKGRAFGEIFHAIDASSHQTVINPVTKVMETNEIYEIKDNVFLIQKDGSKLFIEESAAPPILNSEGNVMGVIVVFRDCTQRRSRQKQIEFLSLHDQLTGLYNRYFFEEELQRLDTNRKLPMSLIMIDVNGLKLTNDAFGHQKGDMILVMVANVLRDACREEDIIARIGGDEFVILLPQTDRETANGGVADRIYKGVSQEDLDGAILSVSIGHGTKLNYDEKMNDIFAEAEEQMYRKKLTESQSMRNQTIQAIMETLNEKNTRERIHSENVGQLCKQIGQAMSLSYENLKDLEMAGLLHDIGKIAIEDYVLNKPGKLTKKRI